jgi:D-3-phosphoglycerate dehydrogenase
MLQLKKQEFQKMRLMLLHLHEGRYVGRLLKAFGCEVIAYDPGIGIKMVEDFVKMYSDLPSMLRHADIVTIHASVKDGECILGKEELSALKKDAVVINTSRGSAIDEQSLYEALVAGNISGAGLDVFEQEPYIGKLKGLDQVVLTSHIGSYAREARRKMEASAVNNMLTCLKKLGVHS